MELTQKEEIENGFIDGGFAMNTHQHGGSSVNTSRVSKWASLVLIATAAAITLFSAAASAADRHENQEDRPPASRKWSRAGSEWTRSRLQRDTTRGLDRDESRHFRVSAARLAHGSGAGRAGPAAAVR